MSHRKQIRTFDMFCGGGGSSRGAVMAGAKPVAALDMWALASETYELNFSDTTTYRMKASSLSPHRVVEEVGNIDLLLASPECTSHSVAKGNKPRCEKSRATAFEVIRFAKVMMPRWIVVENVMQMRRWNRFEEWHRKLRAIGYKTNFDILDAQFHATPQSRRRMFMVCDLETEPTLPKKGHRTTKTVASILGRGEPKQQPWKFSPVDGPKRAKATLERAERAMDELGEKTPYIMVYYGTDGAGGFQALDRPLRTVTTLDRFAYVKPNGRGHEMRMLQPPELAAAMGFPTCHKWPDASRRERIKLIGNAVCPPVMRDVVKTLVGNAN
jgi:DNA (cytosine-5)-methyltransferase 1